MSIPFSKVMKALVAKTSPEAIYSYRVSPLIKAGSVALSLVFFTYGVTFAEWSYESSKTVYKEANEADKKDWKFLAKTFAPMGLTVIPISLAIGAIFVPSRIVTKVTYIPKVNGFPECQLTRRSVIRGKPIVTTRPLSQIVRSEKTRVFTGEGHQGVEDKGTFIFFLTDRSPLLKRWFDKFYILPRSGNFWASDGRVFDALFGGDSIRDLERKTKHGKNGLNTKSLQDIKQDRSILDEMIEENSSRPKLHSGQKIAIISKKIVTPKSFADSSSQNTHRSQ